MSSYHLGAVRHALKTVQLTGEPVYIGNVYLAHLTDNVRFVDLVREFGLVATYDQRRGAWYVERPPLPLRSGGVA